jgi:hypothetical protein
MGTATDSKKDSAVNRANKGQAAKIFQKVWCRKPIQNSNEFRAGLLHRFFDFFTTSFFKKQVGQFMIATVGQIFLAICNDLVFELPSLKIVHVELLDCYHYFNKNEI